jgi:hypothetical protein
VENELRIPSINKGQFVNETLLRGARWGLIGVLAGTIAMDLILISALYIIGQPPLACFAIAGDTVARLFTGQLMDMTTCILLGIITHYSVGPMLGMIFGAAIGRVEALRADTLKRCILLAILYLQILSQPLLALAAIVLQMDSIVTLLWFGGAFVMHTIMGVILGTVVFIGPHTPAKHSQEKCK